MKQKLFEAHYAGLWQSIEASLGSDTPAADFPERYRALCHTLALARQRGYSPSLVARLSELALGAHRLLYGAPEKRELVLMRWVRRDFPRLVRAEWRVVLLSLGVFLFTAALVALAVYSNRDYAYSFSSAYELSHYESMYRDGLERFGERKADSDMLMFGFYIWNNVSICFRVFAGGVFFGLGSLLFVAFNGVHFGLIATWLTLNPETVNNFWSFVITHAALELTGLILAGAAGLRLGLAILKPGRLSRGASLRAAAGRILPMLLGAAIMTFLAAFIEAFWSSRADMPPLVKYMVGGLLWAAVLRYLLFAGRGES
ncbi:stage II sporulation protein M [Chitinilyticum piscinae]|uniref:Stage II sporulation protein M n=1 Tax=Chitinilyticum piscinae TaxID=2866724 RepID=A0A8J7FK81_9NEIS|nr:stage II sporulation protein M [Chitinilyticum piscinae]MBE9609162.1 stage II sporulation protein M [Chitinilyticum piscinae]